MSNDLLYQISLCQVPHIGHVHAKLLCDRFGSAEEIFKASRFLLERTDGIGTVRAQSIKSFRDFNKAEKEIAFIAKYGIAPLFLTDKAYPRRLLNCFDPPTLLFYKGKVDLNATKIVAIVGTRNNSEYGKLMVDKLVKGLCKLDVLIVSGLAFGIDALAHKASLKYGLPTVGVVGHGLDTIYPVQHANLAREMVKDGGLLTEFRSNTKPDKHNFPSRNRVVAGLSDACIIIESGIKGGSMITADIAGSYNRDVFAFPGRAVDGKRVGCNDLIRNNKAVLLSESEQFIEMMCWNEPVSRKPAIQKEMFAEFTGNEKLILELLGQKDQMGIDEINILSAVNSSATAAALLNLEMHGMVQSIPGKQYRLSS